MERKRWLALLPLATAAVLLVAQSGFQPTAVSFPDLFRQPASIDIPADHQALAKPLRELVRSHPQKRQLGGFYLAMADLLPRLPQETTASQFRSAMEKAVLLRFSGEFQKLEGLGQAIHGPEGLIAKIYGLESGKLDVPKMQAALRAVAWACQ